MHTELTIIIHWVQSTPVHIFGGPCNRMDR